MNKFIDLPENVGFILERLKKNGYEAYLVGGCIRNILLSIEPKDYDFTTNASPEEIISSFPECTTVTTGIRFGTVTVIIKKEPYEITTYRVDGEYNDNRRPNEVAFTKSLSEDLKRRDFTVNALAYNSDEGVIDLFGGADDLKNGIIRAIGDPDKRFNEDGLRILRGLRFASQYNMKIEKETADSIHRNRELLRNISVERIADELNKLICGNCEGIIREFHDVFAVFIPELEKCVGFEQHTKYHNRDVFEHILATVSAIKPEKHLRLAMLFHDIGKPDYFTMTGGVGHFKGHANGSREIAERFFKDFKYDRHTAERVVTLVKYHDIVLENRDNLIKRYLNKFGEEMLFDIIDVHIADDMGKAPEYRKRIELYNEIKNRTKEIIRDRECFSVKRLEINGNDLIALGYRGAEIGQKLNQLLDMVIENNRLNKREILLDLAKRR